MRNLRGPATGDPTITLSQDIVLGCYILTAEGPDTEQHRPIYTDVAETRLAYEQGYTDLGPQYHRTSS